MGRSLPIVRSGFTLIELLVVVVIITLLLSILAPSLCTARDQAKGVHCGTLMRGFAEGLARYTAEHNDWIPGVNTSGVALRVLAMWDCEALQDPFLPVQTFDWMTPLIRYETDLPTRRAERMHFLFERFRCPAHRPYSSQPFVGNAPCDVGEFLAIPNWPATSHLMPAAFQYWGWGTRDKVLGWRQDGIFGDVPIRPRIWPDFWSVQVPDQYTARLDEIGAPAGKIFFADGTRFVSNTGLIDHDVSVSPSFLGSFATLGAWLPGSNAYGVAGGSANWDGDPISRGSVSGGFNLPISYRHGLRRRGLQGVRQRGDGTAQGNRGWINMLFFDGHVERVGDRKSRKIDMWYPAGSTIAPGQNIGMTTVPWDYVVR
ncbi:MAG: prepilin-type N-terminal cleavage/methylation domain-containing protein [Phycisphaerae bacterium]